MLALHAHMQICMFVMRAQTHNTDCYIILCQAGSVKHVWQTGCLYLWSYRLTLFTVSLPNPAVIYYPEMSQCPVDIAITVVLIEPCVVC